MAVGEPFVMKGRVFLGFVSFVVGIIRSFLLGWVFFPQLKQLLDPSTYVDRASLEPQDGHDVWTCSYSAMILVSFCHNILFLSCRTTFRKKSSTPCVFWSMRFESKDGRRVRDVVHE